MARGVATIGRAANRIPLAAVPIALITTVNMVFVLGTSDRMSAFAVLFGLVGAAFMAGSLAGFLLGMPRFVSAQRNGDGDRYEPSTSLEQISDWLTKILIGVGIAQASSAVNAVDSFLAGRITTSLDDDPAAYPVALASLLVSVISGFYAAWLLTRLYLAGALKNADADVLRNAAEHVEDSDLKDQLLDLAEQKPEPHGGLEYGPQEYEADVLSALEDVARQVGAAVKRDDRPWDASLVRGSTTISVEIKFSTRDQVFVSTVRNQLGRLVTGRRNPAGVLLVSNRPLSPAANSELAKLEDRNYRIFGVVWEKGGLASDLRTTVEDAFEQLEGR